MCRVVLHVSEALGGGIHTAIFNYAELAPEYSHQIYARVRKGQATHEWPQEVDIVSYEGNLIGFLKSAADHINRENPDVVHLHSSFAGLLRAWLPRSTRVVYSPHCYAMERDSESRIVRFSYRILEAALTRRHNIVAGVSPRELEIATSLNRRTEAVLVPNFHGEPIEVRECPKPRTSLVPTVIGIGRLSEQKDPYFFADVAQKVGPRTSFVWVGDGDREMKDALIEAGVEVTGWIGPSEVVKRLTRADLYLHTARWEGAPLSAIEAATVGCPVIARTIPSMASLDYALGGTTPDHVAIAVQKFFNCTDFREQVCAKTTRVVLDNSAGVARSALLSVYSGEFSLAEPGSQ